MRWMRRLCIIGHLTPNLAKCSNVFLLLQLKYFSELLRTSDAVQWPWHFFIISQLAPNSAECSDVFPFITFHLSFFQIYFSINSQLSLFVQMRVKRTNINKWMKMPTLTGQGWEYTRFDSKR